jgi:hypothetical protein
MKNLQVWNFLLFEQDAAAILVGYPLAEAVLGTPGIVDQAAAFPTGNAYSSLNLLTSVQAQKPPAAQEHLGSVWSTGGLEVQRKMQVD